MMKRSRFTEEQIIGILKEHQAGLGAKELCRKHGVSDATFYKWRAKFGGMEVSDAKKLKSPSWLRTVNRRRRFLPGMAIRT
jgi:putative transposase